MNIALAPELEDRLQHLADEQGRGAQEIVQDALARYMEHETRFRQAVKRGEDALARGEYLSHEEVGARLDRLMRS